MSDLKTTFARFDKDGSGTIELAELDSLLTALLGRNHDDAIVTALANLKTARRDRVTLEEFERWWASVPQLNARTTPAKSRDGGETGEAGKRPRPARATNDAQVQAVFERYDRDGSGEIDTHELADVLEALGLEPDDDQVVAALQRLDGDGSGRLSWDEFRRWWNESL